MDVGGDVGEEDARDEAHASDLGEAVGEEAEGGYEAVVVEHDEGEVAVGAVSKQTEMGGDYHSLWCRRHRRVCRTVLFRGVLWPCL